jgi:hypothetical protein
MLDIQDVIPKQYIPREVATYVSEKMNIPLSRIYDVISFYAALSDVPRADYVIQLCDSVVCKVTDNTNLRDSIAIFSESKKVKQLPMVSTGWSIPHALAHAIFPLPLESTAKFTAISRLKTV